MRYMVVYGTYCVPMAATGNYGTLLSETISNAMRAAPQREVWGQWVGPAPRITRGRFDPCVNQVNAAWLFAYPSLDPPGSEDEARRYDDVIRQRLRERLTATMRAADAGGPGWDFAFLPYTETLHGTTAWWASGEAARTRTYQSPDSGPRENTTGPDDVHPEEIGFGDALSRWARDHKEILIGAGVLTGVGIAAYVVGKVVDAGILRPQPAWGPPPYMPPPAPYGMPAAMPPRAPRPAPASLPGPRAPAGPFSPTSFQGARAPNRRFG